ncbi:VCBS repeat-containing protein [uncultured Paraglaciecola sp.]|uniref:FG-GAP repeat domain-containing protein n=1 Tax=uncultured Paraglaciecola sp. TaxID=1765024 RepID=UPI002619CC8E|nr:VCBS repeat-containing protein [uncultured Paraglaciecola sp.]
MFFSAFKKGNFVLYNQQGHFPPTQLHVLPKVEADFALSVGFGDLDKDGLLEIALGNYVTQEHRRTTDRSRNVLLRPSFLGYQAELLPDPPGAKLLILFSDLNMDGDMDIIFANDFGVPDSLFFGNGSGELNLVMREHNLSLKSGSTSMSYDSADINNDLSLELFLTQTTGNKPSQRARLNLKPNEKACKEISSNKWRQHCELRANLH